MAKASSFEHRRPQRPGGMGRGAMMALLVHAGLLIALAFGVHWRSSEPAGTSAELWAAVPQVAAPAAVTPPPPPPMPKVEPKPEPKVEPPAPKPDTRDADIALEKAKAAEKEKREEQEREKLERQKAEKLEREKAAKLDRDKAEKEKREADAAAAAQEAQRQANIDRMRAQAGATGAPQATGTAQRDAGLSSSYQGKIIARVRPNIVLTDTVPPTLRAEVEVRVAPDGTITARRLTKSSGNSTWDDAVLRAIDRTDTLPKDDDGKVKSPMTLIFTPT